MKKTALKRCEPNKLDELLHPVFDKQALKEAKVLTRGLPASPGAATGQVVFFAEDAAKWAADGKKVVMVRIETSPEDLAGMAVAQGILTARGRYDISRSRCSPWYGENAVYPCRSYQCRLQEPYCRNRRYRTEGG